MVIGANFITMQCSLFLICVSFTVGCNEMGRIEKQSPVLGADSPRAVVSYLQRAMEAREYTKVMNVIAPSDRARYRQYFKLTEDYHADWDKLATAVRERFGGGTALEQAIAEATVLSPLQMHMRNGAIDWAALRFAQPATEQDRLFVQDLSGNSLVELVNLEGKWYAKGFYGGSCSLEHMDVLAKQVAYFRNGIRDLIRIVEDDDPAEVERRIYEALGRSELKTVRKDKARTADSSSGPATRRDCDPLLDD